MKATFIGKENSVVEFDMLFENEEIEKQINKVYLAERGKFSIDGFRKGKAPRKVIEARYGKGVFLEDAVNEMVSDAYPDAVAQLVIRPVATPKIEIKEYNEGENMIVNIKVTVRPEFTPGEYKGVETDKIEPEVTDAQVDAEIEKLQKRNSRILEVERPAQMGDTLTIDFMGFIGEDQFDGGTATDQELELGSNTFIPGFEEQLVGAGVGDDVEVKVTFPEDYSSEDLAGKDAVFKVKVHKIKETEKPELDDEFAKDVSEFDTLDELKEDFRKKLMEDAKNKAEYDMKTAIIDIVYDRTELDVPEDMVEAQITEMAEEIDMQMKYQGLSLPDYLKYMGKTMEEYRKELKPDAYKKMKTRLIIDEIAKLEELEATPGEIDDEIKGMAEHYNIEYDELKNQFTADNIEIISQDIRNRKAIQLMFDEAVFK
ncbi:MAG: trigger factor [Firmicutes bacterium]|nr:trigger factor [Bacillota bacterium]